MNDSSTDSMKTIRDAFWIWGHDAGCHHDPKYHWNIPGENKLGPWEGACALGNIPNCCRVVFAGKPEPPFDDETEKLKGFSQVVWSIVGDAGSQRNNDGGDDLAEVLRIAAKFPNVTGGIVDDFFRPKTRDARMSPDAFHQAAERLHNAPRPLKLWLVYYAALFDIDYSAWLDSADVITFWNWNSRELAHAEENLERVIALTPSKEHLAGCYLYNYGDSRPLTRDEMAFQLDIYYRFLKEGRIPGVIACANTVADIELEAVDYFRNWLAEHGDETLG